MKKLQGYEDVKAPKKPRSKSRERFGSLKDEGLRAYVRGLRCLACASSEEHYWPACGRVESAHVTSKGAAGGDWDNLVPLGERHHAEQHRIGIRSFEYRYGLRLRAAARQVTASYLKWQKENARGLGRPE